MAESRRDYSKGIGTVQGQFADGAVYYGGSAGTLIFEFAQQFSPWSDANHGNFEVRWLNL
jgi:hypothetical protein